MKSSLDKKCFAFCHIITQVIKSQFVICYIGNILGIFFFSLCWIGILDNASTGESHKFIGRSHQFTVPLGKIIIDGDNMDSFSFQSMQITGKRTYKGFSLSSAHFSNSSLAHYDAAHELYRKRFHTQYAAVGFPDHCKSFR